MQGWAVIVRPLYFLAEVFWGAAGIWRDGLKVCGVDAEVFTGSWGKRQRDGRGRGQSQEGRKSSSSD